MINQNNTNNACFTAPLSAVSAVAEEGLGVRLNAHGMVELDCAKWQEGMYLLELVSDEIKLGSTNVVVIHNK